MSVNILDLINTAVGGQLLNTIATLLGEDEQKTAIAFRSAVPGILGGLIKKSETAEGAELVLRSLNGFNGGVLQNFENIVAGGELENFSKIGTGVSQAVLGAEHDITINAVSNYSGVNPLTSATLVGLATPVVLGVLGHEKETSNLDRDGLASFLNGQKLYLVQATPQELMSSLGLDEFFLAKSDTTSTSTSAAASQRVAAASVEPPATAVVESSVNTQSATPQDRKKSGGLLKVLVPLLLVAAIGYGGWQFMQGRKLAELAQQGSIPSTTQTSVETVTEFVTDQTDAIDFDNLNSPDTDQLATADADEFGAQVADEQATQFTTDNTDLEEFQVDETLATQVEEPLDASADGEAQGTAENLALEVEPQDAIADLAVTTAGTSEPEPLEEITTAGVNSVDTSSKDSVTFSESVSSTEPATGNVVVEAIAESIPEPDNVDLTDELGFAPVDSETTPAVESWKPQETVLNTRNVANDAQENVQLVEPTLPVATNSNLETKPEDPAIQAKPQVITGQPYRGGVIETAAPRGVIETYRPQQAVQPQVIQGQPYQGGVVYNAVPNQPSTQGGPNPAAPNPQQYQPQGPNQPRRQYYQGQYYEPAPYQRPLFNGRIIRRFIPLFN